MPASSSRQLVRSLAVSLSLTAALDAQPAVPVPVTQPKQEVRVAARAKGSFDVKLVPLTEGDRKDAWAPGRMSIDKQFKGDLEATSQGEMAMTGTEVQGSAGYTAIEKITGKLHGRAGTFVLQHFAVMARGVPGEWIILVIPDSGTGELKGLTGRLTITITGKEHAYALDYSLPERP